MEVYIPYVGGPAGIANQGSDGLPINETDPTFGYRSGSLQTEAGQVTVTQVLLDRAGPGFSFDRMIFDQLNRAYAPVVDTYVLNQALLNATTQIWSGNAGAFDLTVTSGSGGFYGQVSKAKAGIRTSAGTVLNPQHLFLYATRWEYIAAWSDSQGRPVVVPDYANAFNAVAAGNPSGDVGIEGNTGYRFNGLRAFTDQNIPLFGTTSEDQVIVGDLNEVYVYEGEPVTRAVPQTLAQNLQVLLQQYSYITSIVRYPAAVVSITGTGMSTISYTN
jgi:HK97 family phage major capsid protein